MPVREVKVEIVLLVVCVHIKIYFACVRTQYESCITCPAISEITIISLEPSNPNKRHS
jgi:hypothetical protein